MWRHLAKKVNITAKLVIRLLVEPTAACAIFVSFLRFKGTRHKPDLKIRFRPLFDEDRVHCVPPLLSSDWPDVLSTTQLRSQHGCPLALKHIL